MKNNVLSILLLGVMLLSAACSGGAAEQQTTEQVAEESASQPAQSIDADWVITSSASEGPGSIKEAVSQAVSGDVIAFDPSVFDPYAPVSIYLTESLFLSVGGVTIDASNAGVILDGSMGPETGMLIRSCDNTVYGLKITNFSLAGIVVDGEEDPEKTMHNIIGGDHENGVGPYGQGNCLVANGDGISIQRGASENTVTGNLIGMEADDSPNGNQNNGVIVQADAHRNVIGPRNNIANNGQTGVMIYGGSRGNTITQTAVFNNGNGNVLCQNGGNYELELLINQIESIDKEQGHISAWINLNGENVSIEIYSGDGSGPRFFEGEVEEIEPGENGDYHINFSKSSPFNGEYIYITGYDGEGNSTMFSEAIDSNAEISGNSADGGNDAVYGEEQQQNAQQAISTVLMQPQVVWQDPFDNMDLIDHWYFEGDVAIENGMLVLPPADFRPTSSNEAIAFYAAQSGFEGGSQAVHVTFSFSGGRQFKIGATYNGAESYETFRGGGPTEEFMVIMQPSSDIPNPNPYMTVTTADGSYEAPLVPMEGGTFLEENKTYEMLIAIDNQQQEFFAVVWEPGNFESALFGRMQNDQKLMELTSAGKPWGLSIYQWGGGSAVNVESVEYIVYQGLSLP